MLYQKRGRNPQSCTKLPAKNELDIQEAICKNTPDVLGLPCVLWTRKAVCEYVEKKYGVKYYSGDKLLKFYVVIVNSLLARIYLDILSVA